MVLFELRKSFEFQSTVFPKSSSFNCQMFMAEGRYRFASPRIRNHSISFSGGIGSAAFAIPSSKKDLRDSIRKGTQCFDFSIGYRFETGFGWVEDYDTWTKSPPGRIMNIKVFLNARAGFLYANQDIQSFYFSLGGGLQFQWARQSNRPTKIALKRNRWKEVPNRIDFENLHPRLKMCKGKRSKAIF